MGMRGPGAQSAERSEVDDPALPLAQAWGCGTRDDKRAARVAREHLVPLRDGEFLEWNGLVESGVIDEHVDIAESALDFLNRLAHIALVGNVAAQCKGFPLHAADLGDKLFRLCFGIEISERNVCAAFCHAQRDSATDAKRSAGDQD